MQLARRLGKFGLARVGHLRRQIEQRLLAVPKVRRHHQLARLGQAEPLAHVLEAALHGERGRSQHHRGNGLEDQLAQQFRDVDRRGLQKRRPRLMPQLCARSRLASGGPPQHAAPANTPCCLHSTPAGTRARCAVARRACVSPGASSTSFRRSISSSIRRSVVRTPSIQIAGCLEKLLAVIEWLAAVAGHGQSGKEHPRAVAKLLRRRRKLLPRPPCRAAECPCRAPALQSECC